MKEVKSLANLIQSDEEIFKYLFDKLILNLNEAFIVEILSSLTNDDLLTKLAVQYGEIISKNISSLIIINYVKL